MILEGDDGRPDDGWRRPDEGVDGVPDEDQLARALLARLNAGDVKAREELFELVIADLRRIARNMMSAQDPAHTLQATAVVNEAYLRLYGGPPLTFKDRAHFLRAAALAMRWVLVDHARRKATRRRAGLGGTVELESAHGASSWDPAQALLEFDEELECLARVKPDMARAISLRNFLGLPMDEVAQVLDIPKRTLEREFQAALALLASRLVKR